MFDSDHDEQASKGSMSNLHTKQDFFEAKLVNYHERERFTILDRGNIA